MNSLDQMTFDPALLAAMQKGFEAAQSHKKYIKELEAKVKELEEETFDPALLAEMFKAGVLEAAQSHKKYIKELEAKVKELEEENKSMKEEIDGAELEEFDKQELLDRIDELEKEIKERDENEKLWDDDDDE